MQKVQSIRGMNDILPGAGALWHTLDVAVTEVFSAYGYQQVRLPLVERTSLFKRAVGEVTDIVEKEMYSFADRGGEDISLRPEGTAGCVRAGIEHGLLHNQTQRFWYGGPMFRYERPQKGRYRQFHQYGVEAFGATGPDVDAEQIAMSARLWRRLGIQGLELHVNSLGTSVERQHYRAALVTYLQAHHDALDADSKRRLETNPLRILDSKNPQLATVISNAPQLSGHLESESRAHFDTLLASLSGMGIECVVNPRLVRGLDYYSRTVFEWRTDQLGAQDAVCSGGRYDGLVELLGGRSTPAVGFALGVERLIALMQQQDVVLLEDTPHVYLVCRSKQALATVPQLAETLRDQLPGLRMRVNAGAGSFKSQFKQADKSGAAIALIVGEQEALEGRVQIKPLRATAEQQSVPQAQLARWLAAALELDYTESI